MSTPTSTTNKPVWSILNKGTFASVLIKLPKNTEIHCESDAIVSMSDGLVLTGEMRGGFFNALMRLFLTQETFFATLIKAKSSNGDVLLAANEPGDIMLHSLTPNHADLLLTRGSYVAADTSVNITTKLQKHVSKAKLSGTGLFLIRAYGSGTIACSSYGAIHKFTLVEGEHRIVDNGHLIGWSADMQYKVGKATSSLTGAFTTGEGIMLHFTGPGDVYVQSHTPKIEMLADAALPRKRKGRKIILYGVLVLIFVLFIVGVNVYFKIKEQTWFEKSVDEEL